jgi:hypothetical protein
MDMFPFIAAITVFAVYCFVAAVELALRGNGSLYSYAMGWILLGSISFWIIRFPSSSLWILLVTAPAILGAALAIAVFTHRPFERAARAIHARCGLPRERF